VWRDEYHYGTETAKMAWSSEPTSMCYNCRPQRPGNWSRKRKSKRSVHSSLYRALIIGSGIGCASGAHAGLPLSLEIALVPVQES